MHVATLFLSLFTLAALCSQSPLSPRYLALRNHDLSERIPISSAGKVETHNFRYDPAYDSHRTPQRPHKSSHRHFHHHKRGAALSNAKARLPKILKKQASDNFNTPQKLATDYAGARSLVCDADTADAEAARPYCESHCQCNGNKLVCYPSPSPKGSFENLAPETLQRQISQRIAFCGKSCRCVSSHAADDRSSGELSNGLSPSSTDSKGKWSLKGMKIPSGMKSSGSSQSLGSGKWSEGPTESGQDSKSRWSLKGLGRSKAPSGLGSEQSLGSLALGSQERVPTASEVSPSSVSSKGRWSLKVFGGSKQDPSGMGMKSTNSDQSLGSVGSAGGASPESERLDWRQKGDSPPDTIRESKEWPNPANQFGGWSSVSSDERFSPAEPEGTVRGSGRYRYFASSASGEKLLSSTDSESSESGFYAGGNANGVGESVINRAALRG